MLIMAMDYKRIVFYGILPQKTNVTGQIYESFPREKMLPYVGRATFTKFGYLRGLIELLPS